MDNYKSNSFKSKEAVTAPAETNRVKTDKVITGTAKVRKKSEIGKLAGSIISEDAGNVMNYILTGVLIPSIKDALYDIVVNGAKMFLFGENAGTSSRRSGSTNSRVSYRSYYDNDRRTSTGNSIPKKSGYDFDPIIFDNRGDAEYTLDKMQEIIDSQYQVVSVMDMYCAAGLDCPYTYDSYGWTSLAGADIQKVRDGWMIRLPKALPLK